MYAVYMVYAGLCFKGLQTNTKLHIFLNTCRNSLYYVCEAVHLCSQNIIDLDNIYSKLLKQMLELGIVFVNILLYFKMLTPSIRAPPGPGGVMATSCCTDPPGPGGLTLGFRFGISSDRLLKFAACFH